jgi:hypothetical protein
MALELCVFVCDRFKIVMSMLLKIKSSGMIVSLCRQLISDNSKERSASIFRVQRSYAFDPEEDGDTILQNLGIYLPVGTV